MVQSVRQSASRADVDISSVLLSASNAIAAAQAGATVVSLATVTMSVTVLETMTVMASENGGMSMSCAGIFTSVLLSTLDDRLTL